MKRCRSTLAILLALSCQAFEQPGRGMTATQHRYPTKYGGPQWRDAPCIDGLWTKNGVIGNYPQAGSR